MGRIENINMSGIITYDVNRKFQRKVIPHTAPVTYVGSGSQNFKLVPELSFSNLTFDTYYAVDFLLQCVTDCQIFFAFWANSTTLGVRNVGAYKEAEASANLPNISHRFIFKTDPGDGNLSLFVGGNLANDITLGLNSTPTGISCEVTIEELPNAVEAVGDIT